VLGGGLTAEQLYVIEGVPGTGKTTLALQFLLAGVERGESVLHVTLSETAQELHAIAASHGLSLDGVAIHQVLPRGDTLDAADDYTVFHPSEVELTEATGRILEQVEARRPTRLVLDSLSEIRLLAGSALRHRRQVLAFKQYFTGRGCTVLMLDDRTSRDHDLQVQSIAHGVILLDQSIRTTARSGGAWSCASSAARSSAAATTTSGSAAADSRCSRAWSRPSTARCCRPTRSRAQTSSSTVCSGAASIAERARSSSAPRAPGNRRSPRSSSRLPPRAERLGQMFIFDESIATLLERCDGLGIDLRKQVESGRLRIDPIDPAELSPGEFSSAVRRSVEVDGATLVVLDSPQRLPERDAGRTLPEHPAARDPRLSRPERRRDTVGLRAPGAGGRPDGIRRRCHLPRRHRHPAPLFRSARRDPYGDLRNEAARRSARAHDPRVPARARRISIGEPLRQFRGVLTGVPVFEGGDEELMKDRRQMTDAGAHALEERVIVLAPTGRDADLIGSVLVKAASAGRSAATYRRCVASWLGAPVRSCSPKRRSSRAGSIALASHASSPTSHRGRTSRCSC
jgi:circadian clock protein KaiC